MLTDAGEPPDWATLILCLAESSGPAARRIVADALGWDDARLDSAIAGALAEEAGSIDATPDTLALTVMGRLRSNELAATMGRAPSSSDPGLRVPKV
jgi:hypothetical protein